MKPSDNNSRLKPPNTKPHKTITLTLPLLLLLPYTEFPFLVKLAPSFGIRASPTCPMPLRCPADASVLSRDLGTDCLRDGTSVLHRKGDPMSFSDTLPPSPLLISPKKR